MLRELSDILNFPQISSQKPRCLTQNYFIQARSVRFPINFMYNIGKLDDCEFLCKCNIQYLV